jgi:hypothetical protein
MLAYEIEKLCIYLVNSLAGHSWPFFESSKLNFVYCQQDYNLPAPRVYVDAGRALARQYRFAHIQQLLKCVGEMGLVSDKCHDDIILACVRIVSADQNQVSYLNTYQ